MNGWTQISPRQDCHSQIQLIDLIALRKNGAISRHCNMEDTWKNGAISRVHGCKEANGPTTVIWKIQLR